MKERARKLFEEYAAAHATAGNQRFHAIGIPLIVFAIVAALTLAPLAGPWTLAEAVIAAVAIGQLALDPPGACLVLSFEIASDAAARLIASAGGRAAIASVAAAAFVAGWIFQLLGHAVHEKNRPAFTRNLVHLLVGPLWIARKLGRAS